VTALSTTDSPEGWRPVKNDSGAVIDVASNQTIMTGLCMPHSPRWYNGQLWLLESGQGLLGVGDLVAGQFDPVARVPGFPRGLDFIGPYALVGVSHVRQSSTFDGLPISQRVERPMCGVSIINLTSGQEVGFVRFEEAVRETFDVRFLPHRFPELLEPGDPLLDFTFAIPDDALADVVPARQPDDGQHE
jgi:uncharacterized protein (TIGR03032 family)